MKPILLFLLLAAVFTFRAQDSLSSAGKRLRLQRSGNNRPQLVLNLELNDSLHRITATPGDTLLTGRRYRILLYEAATGQFAGALRLENNIVYALASDQDCEAIAADFRSEEAKAGHKAASAGRPDPVPGHRTDLSAPKQTFIYGLFRLLCQ